MSEALLELGAPYRSGAESRSEYEALVALAALAWNVASLPEAEQERQLAQAEANLKHPDATTVRQVVRALIERKRRLFPDDHRLVVSYDVAPHERGYHLMVASTDLSSPPEGGKGPA